MTNELAQQQIEWEQLLAAKNAEIERLRVCWAEALENVATRNREIEQLMKERHQLRNELTAARLENQRLQEVLTIPNITPDTTSSALFIRTLSEHEKGQPVNGQDLINALMWRVKNQRKEIARLQEKRGSSEPSGRQCQHDLLKPDTTVIVAGSYDASCPICKGEWHLPHPEKSSPALAPQCNCRVSKMTPDDMVGGAAGHDAWCASLRTGVC